jgi:hypothetical protein
VLKSKGMRWVECIARKGKMRNAHTFLVGKENIKGREYGGI